jgi:hypothetical protein
MGFNVGGNFTSGDFKYSEGNLSINDNTPIISQQPQTESNNDDDEDLKELITLLKSNNDLLESISTVNDDMLKVLNTNKDENVKQLAGKLIVKFGEFGFNKIKKYFE